VEGPSFQGKVLPGSSDHVLVCPSGVGIIHVRAAVETYDGAMLELEETGRFDFGKDGYARAAARDLPEYSKLVCCPRVSTGHPKYLWLNRVFCVALGTARASRRRVEYNLFAVPTPVLTPVAPS